jgi:hypothetical protein
MPDSRLHQLIARQLVTSMLRWCSLHEIEQIGSAEFHVFAGRCLCLQFFSLRPTTAASASGAAPFQPLVHLQNASGAKPLAFWIDQRLSVVVIVVAVLAGQGADRPTRRATQ